MSSTRTWLPADYLDEVIPTPRPSPSDWIITLPGDAYALAPAEDDHEPREILKAGDVVEFYWTESYGTVDIDIRAAGTFAVVGGTVDPRANCVRADFDNDTVDDSVASLAENWIENGRDPGVFVVDQYSWSKGEDYRFETAASEGPRFVPVDRSVREVS